VSDVPPQSGESPQPVELQGGYRALRAIAHTKLFNVLLVESIERGHKLVWKVLRPEAATDPDALGRFIDEAGLVQQLVHPNLVRSLGAGRLADGAYYLATEYLEGQTLKERLTKSGVLTADAVVRLMGPICAALQYMHERNIVHRDLRPEKVFLTTDGVPKLLDFGLAHFGGTRSVSTAPGVLLGRPQYTPPECIMGQRCDARGDVYALGITLFEALTGRPPFDGPDGEVLSQQLTGAVPRLPPTAAHLQPIVDRCLAKEPSRRFEAKDLATALEQFGVLPASKVDPTQVIALTAMLNGVAQGDVLGNYRIEKMLGDGGMGQVFKARHLKLDREVAIKLLKPQQAQSDALVERFFREARAVNRIKHEHIIEIHDFVDETTDRGVRRSYCVMELLEGASLLGVMAREPLTVARAVKLVRQAASALHAAHQVGITHRDVKPDNIFVTTRSGAEFVKVLDFGVAKLAGPDDKELVSKTLAGLVVGTPAYMSPEQVQGFEVGPACDIYALGTVLYEILAERRPFVAPGYLQLAMQITTELPPPLPAQTSKGEKIPPQLQAIVMRCLSKAPNLRFASMKELSDALEPFEDVGTGEAPAQPRRVSAELVLDVNAAMAGARAPNRTPLFLSLASVLVLLGLGGVALMGERPEPRVPVAPGVVAPAVVPDAGAPGVEAAPTPEEDDPPPLPPVSPVVEKPRPVRKPAPVRKTSTIDPYAN